MSGGIKLSTTVLDALENGLYNLLQGIPELGIKQLSNGITALKNGMYPEDVMQEHFDAPVILHPSGMND